jgi:small-conductance mechanosensitive channel
MAGKWRLGKSAPWLVLVAAMALILAMAFFDFPIPLPELPVGPYAFYLILVFILLATKLALELMKPLFKAALSHKIPHEADIFALYQVVSYVIGFVVLVVVIYLALGGFNPLGELGIGIIGAMLLYLLQAPLLNFVGWFAIAVRRIYKLGDRIEINGVRGYVTEITIVGTTLREFGGWMSGDSFTGRYIVVPNRWVLDYNVANYTKDTEFVWDEVTVAVTYESDMNVAEKYLLEIAEDIVGPMMKANREVIWAKHEFTDLANYMSDRPEVQYSLKESWVNLTVSYFVPCHQRDRVKSEISKKILAVFRADPRVAIAYPHLEVVPYKQADMETMTRTILSQRRGEE